MSAKGCSSHEQAMLVWSDVTCPERDGLARAVHGRDAKFRRAFSGPSGLFAGRKLTLPGSFRLRGGDRTGIVAGRHAALCVIHSA